MPNDEGMWEGFLVLRLFGSRARGDADAFSDSDLLVVAREDFLKTPKAQRSLRILMQKFDDVSVYGEARFREMHAKGHLFAWHVFLESRPLAGLQVQAATPDAVATLGPPAPYTDGPTEAEELVRVLDESVVAAPKTPNATFEAGVMFVAARNLGVVACAVSGEPHFSPRAPYVAAERTGIRFPLSMAEYDLLRRSRKASVGGRPSPALEPALLTGWAARLTSWARDTARFVACKKENDHAP